MFKKNQTITKNDGLRVNSPFAGICSFIKCPICFDLDDLEADVAVIGVPYDMGTTARSGARFGPRAIREASTINSDGLDGAYDPESDTIYLLV